MTLTTGFILRTEGLDQFDYLETLLGLQALGFVSEVMVESMQNFSLDLVQLLCTQHLRLIPLEYLPHLTDILLKVPQLNEPLYMMIRRLNIRQASLVDRLHICTRQLKQRLPIKRTSFQSLRCDFLKYPPPEGLGLFQEFAPELMVRQVYQVL